MDELREMTVTPDRYLTYRYAGASGDFNPIHLDDEFARSVELPSRILHGLWTMAQVARAQGEAAGDPLALKSLSVQFRGMGVPEKEITVTSKLKSQDDGEAVYDCEAVQDGNKLVRRGRAFLRVPPGS
jgi:acyl dehydratase